MKKKSSFTNQPTNTTQTNTTLSHTLTLSLPTPFTPYNRTLMGKVKVSSRAAWLIRATCWVSTPPTGTKFALVRAIPRAKPNIVV